MITKNTLFASVVSKINALTLAAATKSDDAIHYVRTQGVGQAALAVALAGRQVEQVSKIIKNKALSVGLDRLRSALSVSAPAVAVTEVVATEVTNN